MNLDEIKEFVIKKHDGQKRKQGTPYYLHPFAVAQMIKEKGYNEGYQAVGLAHDLIEDTDTTFEELVDLTSRKVANAVKLVTKEKGYIMFEYMERIAQNDMAKMVKLADRVHNLSEANLTTEEFRKKYIKETEEWYIHLAKNTSFEEDLRSVLIEVKQSLGE